MGKVIPSKDGLVLSNDVSPKSEPLITVDKLKSTYLTGLNIKDPNTGLELSNEVYQTYINNSVSMLEHFLDMSISPVNEFVEHKDYHANDYSEWGFMMLNNYPVRAVRKIEMVYFRDENGDAINFQEIPLNWIRLGGHDGEIRLIPNSKFPASLQIGRHGGYFPEILRAQTVPHLWRVTYDFGFESGCIPIMLNMAIAQIAAIQALVVGGNLVLGAGIAGSSISLDGLSQSIQTTQSAENSAFSASIKDYSDKIFGKTKDDPFAILKILKRYYKGQDFNIL